MGKLNIMWSKQIFLSSSIYFLVGRMWEAKNFNNRDSLAFLISCATSIRALRWNLFLEDLLRTQFIFTIYEHVGAIPLQHTPITWKRCWFYSANTIKISKMTIYSKKDPIHTFKPYNSESLFLHTKKFFSLIC